MGFKAQVRKGKAGAEEKAADSFSPAVEYDDVSIERYLSIEIMGFKAQVRKGKAGAEEKAADSFSPAVEYDDVSIERYRQFELYKKKLEECGPFDIDYFPDTLIYGMLRSCGYHEYEGDKNNVDRCVRHAIDFGRKEKKLQLEDPQIIRANRELGSTFIYYITFYAKDKKSGMRQVYETKVYLDYDGFFLGKGPSTVWFLRDKNHKKKTKLANDYTYFGL